MDRSLTAINSNKRKMAATVSKGNCEEWRKAKTEVRAQRTDSIREIFGSGPKYFLILDNQYESVILATAQI